MPVQDRTNEFRACVESIRSRSSVPARSNADQKQRLLQQSKTGGSKSEFTKMASAIGKDISSTAIKLGKLAQREYDNYRSFLLMFSSPQSRSGKLCSMIGLWRLE